MTSALRSFLRYARGTVADDAGRCSRVFPGHNAIGACIQGPLFIVERVLVFAPEGAHTLAVMAGQQNLPLSGGFMPWCSTPIVAKLRKPNVSVSANHHPMRLEAYGFFGLSKGALLSVSPANPKMQ